MNFLALWWKEVIGLIVTALAIIFRDYLFKGIKFIFRGNVEAEVENIKQQLSEFENNSNKKDAYLNDKLDKITDEVILIKQALKSKTLDSILEKCKTYITKENIDIDQLTLLEREYELYHSLGGNGYADEWMHKVRQIPVVETNN